MIKQAHIVVVGGGYAGVVASSRLAGRLRGQASVTLVSDRDDLVHRIRLHETLAGRKTAAMPLRSLIPDNVTLLRGRVARIDAAAHRLTLDDGGVLSFDSLIIAVGSRVSAIAGAHPWLSSPESAQAGSDRLRGLPPGSAVVVVGDGLTAIECVCEIAEAHPTLRVHLVGPDVGGDLAPVGAAAVRKALHALGVAIVTGRVRHVEHDAVILDDNTRIASAFTVFAAGAEAGGIGMDGDLARDGKGRFVITESLRAINCSNVFVVGDAAAPPTHLPELRMSCNAAMPMAAHAADEIARRVNGGDERAFRFRFAVRCISLGRHRALIQHTDGADRPLNKVWSGQPAVFVKEAICRYVIGALRVERHFAGAYQWLKSSPTPLLPASTP